ncbi:hypothetical protein H112_08844 [Trichophyton rubrum D6]|uniref:Uncharacterized protein n=2 Tax=Trichophyton TaxID=5550 RepID=A0A022VMR7_TRIRU|nr:hypothetical protein H100_08865 [Trichophyton rubrum MR850]EZF36679.1 hypothetical protein H102_08826 [Trichophyton rubrum CBS 100081]EZF47271.1 hypothetical protein H103_08848 [Trichophyton rubrum CBS 288.86]EZF58009.1 hypothetical protein H104_08796 [Trichophyton rubrum CBS 289.86]EZF68515.1 hypothetical protein H105_08851 [Trichophyton soudanense CBS 452.61]EZF79227.1 hypothetical protein H110_08849 [Trichophyton rubrum MR1448]EZG11418.1 hypothetical protein H107_09004 [Trichophyton rub
MDGGGLDWAPKGLLPQVPLSSGPEAGAYAERMGRIAPIRLSLAQDVDAPFPLVHVCVTALVLVSRRCWWIGSRSASSAGSVGRRAGQSVRNGERWETAVDAKRETIRLQTASINSDFAELARLGPIVVGRHLSH